MYSLIQCHLVCCSWEQERIQSETHIAELDRRLQSRDQECEQLREERIRLLGLEPYTILICAHVPKEDL